MAVISYNDLLKRDNPAVFAARVKNKGSFLLKTEDGNALVCTGKARMKMNNKTSAVKLTDGTMRLFLNEKKGSDYLEIEVMDKKSKKWMRPTFFFKDKDFGGVAGKSSGGGSERQELGLINMINKAAKKSSNFYFKTLGTKHKMLKAEKNEGLSSVGQEPYIDVYILTQAGKKLGISNKGETAPSLAGGGLVGIQTIAPELLDKLYIAVKKYIKKIKLKDGDVVDANSVPDIFIRIPDQFVKKILTGNAKMGGPIDYMYIGKMDVVGKANPKSGEITVNGSFYSVAQYMKKVPDFYFRIRKRDLDSDNQMEIALKRTNKDGYPIIFQSARTGKNNFRLVITDKIPSTGIELKI